MMPHQPIRWLPGRWLAGLTVATAIALCGPVVMARETAKPVGVTSFSGAFLAARVAEGDNDLDNAITYYKQALAFAPDDVPLQQSLMLTLIAQGRFDEALPYADKLKEVPDIERFSRLALAVDTFRKKDYPKAEYWLKLSLQADLDRLISGVMTGWAQLGSGHDEDAISYIAGLKGPEWFDLFRSYHRALIADVAGQKEAADKAYRATLENTSAGGAAPETWLRNAEAYARFLNRNGKQEEALSVLERSEEFVTGRVEIEALRDSIATGEDIAPMVAGPADGAAEILVNLATALNRGGGEPFVRLYLEYALALRPDSDIVLMQLAGVAEQMRDSARAISYYKRISDTSAYKQVAELQLGLNLADLDRKDEAIEHLSALVEAQPDEMRGYLALGGVYGSQENWRASADLYDRAVKRLKTPEPADWNVFYQRGIAHERLKEWSAAEPNFRKALELNPEQPQVMNYLGYSWVDMNMNLEEALEMIERAAELRPSDGYIIDSLGWAYYKLNRFEDAVSELERAVSLRPEDPVLNDHLGDAYWRVGRRLEATFQWSYVRDLDPEPDVLEQVEKKLQEGLPTIEPATAQDVPKPKQPEPKG
ncbi:tetratricopeptide repeat protein [Aquamicrobium segne]|uniref:Tetratricopeptide repeat protein n=1 Tax=Aquamicrobium segne TaxID=469547 RepID=A0ABW0GVF9_9HYPH